MQQARGRIMKRLFKWKNIFLLRETFLIETHQPPVYVPFVIAPEKRVSSRNIIQDSIIIVPHIPLAQETTKITILISLGHLPLYVLSPTLNLRANI